MNDIKKQKLLLNQIKYLSTKIKGYAKIDKHKMQSLINDTFLKLLEKERNGIIKLDNYEEYKGYMFISIKNAIYRHFKYQKSLKGKQERVYMEETPHTSPSQTIQFNGEIKKLLYLLTPIQRSIFRWHYQRNWEYPFLAKTLGISISGVGGRMTRIRKKLLKHLK